MKNWKYIEGAKNGNSLSDKLKTIGRDKIVLTSPNGGKIILHKDGDAFVSEKGEIQTILEKNPSFEAALEKYKSKGYKIGNSKIGNIQYHKVGKITIKLEANDDDWTVYDTNGHELKSGKGGLGRAKTWAEHFARFTNKRTGNVASEYEILKQDPSKMHPLYKKAYEETMKKLAREDEDFKKRFEKEYGVKAKNENGLARARNAIKKS